MVFFNIHFIYKESSDFICSIILPDLPAAIKSLGIFLMTPPALILVTVITYKIVQF